MSKPNRPNPVKPVAANLPSAFAALAPLRDQLAQQAGAAKQDAERAAKQASKQPVAAQPPPQPPQPELSDEAWLAIAMSGTQRLEAGTERVAPPLAKAPLQAAAAQIDPQAAALPAEPDLPDFWQPGVDPQFLWALGGDKPWQGRSRLRGTLSLARGQLADAIKQARIQHHVCLLVDWMGVERPAGPRTSGEILREVLQTGAAGPILGYRTAKPADGGTYALYVWVVPSV